MRFEELIPQDGIAVRTRSKLRHSISRWMRLGGCESPLDVTTATIASVRSSGVDSKLSAKTIESTISDVLTLLSLAGRKVDPGRRLRVVVNCKSVPEMECVEKLYSLSNQWRFPARLRTISGSFVDVSVELRESWLKAFVVIGIWTGLRLQDLLSLKWGSISQNRIAWRASKTSREHRFPMCDVVRSHLEPLKALDRPTVFGVSGSNPTLIRDELHRVMPMGTITPQALRRASVTTWATVSPEAGRIVHGTGLGVLRHYYDGEQILRACCDRFPWPVSMLPPDQRDERQRLANETSLIMARLSPERIADVLRVARAFAG